MLQEPSCDNVVATSQISGEVTQIRSAHTLHWLCPDHNFMLYRYRNKVSDHDIHNFQDQYINICVRVRVCVFHIFLM